MPFRFSLTLALLTALGCQRTPDHRPNVLLISMDTLRADHLGSYGYARDTSPAIDAVAAAGTRFADASSTSSWTTPAHASLFTGRYPSSLGVVRYDEARKRVHRLAAEETTLAEILRDAGYQTRAFTGGGFVSAQLGFSQGFDDYLERSQLRDYRERLVDWITTDAARRPFFLFVHFYDCHRPYTPPQRLRGHFGTYTGTYDIRRYCLGTTHRTPSLPADWQYVVSQYDAEIFAADEQLRSVFEALDRSGLARRTLVVFLSDHGDELGEHGDCDHIHTLYQELVHVPLLFRGPGVRAGAVVEQPVSLADVAPTILDYLGMPIPPQMEGESLLPLLRGTPAAGGPAADRPLFMETAYGDRHLTAVRRGERKLIFDRHGEPTQLYDVASDPGDTKNLWPRQSPAVNALLRAYREYSARAKPGSEHAAPLSPELESQLESLGYLR